MFRLFSLAPAVFSGRGLICIFKCPRSNVEGSNLSSFIHDSAHLNCRYTTSSTIGIQAAYVHNKVGNLSIPLCSVALALGWPMSRRSAILPTVPSFPSTSKHSPSLEGETRWRGERSKCCIRRLQRFPAHNGDGHAMDNCCRFAIPRGQFRQRV